MFRKSIFFYFLFIFNLYSMTDEVENSDQINSYFFDIQGSPRPNECKYSPTPGRDLLKQKARESYVLYKMNKKRFKKPKLKKDNSDVENDLKQED